MTPAHTAAGSAPHTLMINPYDSTSMRKRITHQYVVGSDNFGQPIVVNHDIPVVKSDDKHSRNKRDKLWQ